MYRFVERYKKAWPMCVCAPENVSSTPLIATHYACSQYCSDDFQSLLKQYDIVCSILKSEQVYYADYQTPDEARKDIVDYIEMFYNSCRAHSYLGYLSPNEYESIQQVLPQAA